jgi:hypothetical protein
MEHVMTKAESAAVSDGSRLAMADVVEAMTRTPSIYTDGATQVFTPDGQTTYVENGSQSQGAWG